MQYGEWCRQTCLEITSEGFSNLVPRPYMKRPRKASSVFRKIAAVECSGSLCVHCVSGFVSPSLSPHAYFSNPKFVQTTYLLTPLNSLEIGTHIQDSKLGMSSFPCSLYSTHLIHTIQIYLWSAMYISGHGCALDESEGIVRQA